MPIQFQCSECRTRLSTARRKILSTVTCPKCKSAITVPGDDLDLSEVTPQTPTIATSSRLQKDLRFGLLDSNKRTAVLAIVGGMLVGVLSLSFYGQKKELGLRDVEMRNIEVEASSLSEKIQSRSNEAEATIASGLAYVPKAASVPEVVGGIDPEVDGEDLTAKIPTALVAGELSNHVYLEPAHYAIVDRTDGIAISNEPEIEQAFATSVEESRAYFNIQVTEVKPLELFEISSSYSGYWPPSTRDLIQGTGRAEAEKKPWDPGKVFAWQRLQNAKYKSNYNQSKSPLKFRRYIRRSEEDLSKRLNGVPEIDRNVSQRIAAQDEAIAKILTTGPDREMIEMRRKELVSEPYYAGLPFADKRNHYQKKNFATMKDAAKGYRNLLACFDNPTDNFSRSFDAISMNSLVSNKAASALRQIWMGDEKLSTRLLMVEFMSAMTGREATEALAMQAIFDFDAKVREQAVLALRERPEEDYREILLSGFRYPFSPVAENAAEAVVNLEVNSVVPQLREYLDNPNPSVSISSAAGNQVREVVKINHLGNCNLCHAPSYNKIASSRAAVARVGESIPVVYYEGQEGQSRSHVRFDTVFLHQDFSRAERVENPGIWPKVQRFDYVVRTRTVGHNEEISSSSSDKEYMDAILFALQELAQEDPVELIAERNAKRSGKSIALSTRAGD